MRDLLTATPGELADQLGAADAALQQASDRMDQIERELKRRGCNRAAGTRYAAILGDGGIFLVDLGLIAESLATMGEPGEGAGDVRA